MRSTAARVAPTLVTCAFLALYAVTRVAVHRFDAVSYMLAAQSAAPRFDPHHLLYTRLAWLVGAETGTDRLVVAMQALSSVCAAVGLGLYCWLLQAVLPRASAWWAVIGAGLLGVSSSFWISAGESDPYALTLACLIAATVCYRHAVEHDTLAGHFLAGLAVAAATLVHQLVVLYTLAYVLGLVFGRVRRTLVCAIIFLAPAAAVPTVIYLAVAVRAESVRDVPALLRWLTRYAHMGYWGVFDRDNVVEALYGFLYAFAGGGGGLVSPVVVRTMAVVAMIVVGYAVVRRLRAISTGGERAFSALLIGWIALYMLFIVWWAPDLTTHWQFVLVPLILLVMWTAACITPRPRITLAAGMAAVVVVGTANYVRVVWPLTVPENDRASVFVRHALATLPRDARLVAPVGVATNLIAARLGAESVFVVPPSVGTRATSAQIIASLRAFVDAAGAYDRPVWVFGSLLEPSGGRLSDSIFKVQIRQLLEELRAEGRLVVLSTNLLEQPMRRHPWDVLGS